MLDNPPSKIINALFADSKGILAADESTKSINKRFEALNIVPTEENRQKWRELLVSTTNFSDYISGVILYDETFNQKMSSGQRFTQFLTSLGVLSGIKVDKGLVDMPNFEPETITEGLDGLDENLANYKKLGASFTKWRAAFLIDSQNHLPSSVCIHSNLNVMARYASLAQKNGLIPIVEPEVLYSGNHSIIESQQVTSMVLRVTFDLLKAYRVDLSNVILKTSMVLAGSESKKPSKPDEVAEFTLHTLKQRVPDNVGGIVFLSGGQTPDQALQNFNQIGIKSPKLPWPVSFSFSRALQDEAMSIWKGQEKNIIKAQKMFQTRLQNNSTARHGQYIAKKS